MLGDGLPPIKKKILCPIQGALHCKLGVEANLPAQEKHMALLSCTQTVATGKGSTLHAPRSHLCHHRGASNQCRGWTRVPGAPNRGAGSPGHWPPLSLSPKCGTYDSEVVQIRGVCTMCLDQH